MDVEWLIAVYWRREVLFDLNPDSLKSSLDWLGKINLQCSLIVSSQWVSVLKRWRRINRGWMWIKVGATWIVFSPSDCRMTSKYAHSPNSKKSWAPGGYILKWTLICLQRGNFWIKGGLELSISDCDINLDLIPYGSNHNSHLRSLICHLHHRSLSLLLSQSVIWY